MGWALILSSKVASPRSSAAVFTNTNAWWSNSSVFGRTSFRTLSSSRWWSPNVSETARCSVPEAELTRTHVVPGAFRAVSRSASLSIVWCSTVPTS
jgi:hypothetical protein